MIMPLNKYISIHCGLWITDTPIIQKEMDI